MNGVHDIGGMHGFGPVEIERDEPVFHHEWERRVFAILPAAAFLGEGSIAQFRFAVEQTPPAKYLATAYYEHWLFGLEKLLHEHGLVATAEFATRLMHPAAPVTPATGQRVLAARDVDKVLRARQGSRVNEDI